MYAIVSAAIRERSSTSSSSPAIPGQENNALHNEEREGAPAPSRFAAAQQLFRRQQTMPPKPPSPPFIAPKPTSPSRHRSFTASSSLYSKLEQSIQADSTSPEERASAVSSPERMSFAESFGQPRPQHNIHPTQEQAAPSQSQTPVDPSCILPGPKYTSRPFDITAIKGTTATGKAAWWCRHDRLVVFDGLKPVDEHHTGRHHKRLLVRSSKGLEMSRRNCPKEVIHVDIPCQHCRDTLGKKSWKYEARVQKTRICERCQNKCWAEVEARHLEEEITVRQAEKEEKGQQDNRRDSFLMQGDVAAEEKSLRKVQSEKNLKAGANPDSQTQKDPTHVDTTPDLRKVRSDRQLQRAPTMSIDEISFIKPPPLQTDTS
jgi:hypothetical protein